MAKTQTRRSVSLNRKLHDDAKALAAKKNTSLSALTEEALRVSLVAAQDPQLAAAFDAMLSRTKMSEATS